jgi:hypothetical protein
MRYHLAQANVARPLAPLDDPLMASFVAQLDAVNAAADRSEGFVWRYTADPGDTTVAEVFGNDRLLFNMSVWESIEALQGYVYRGDHLGPLRARRQWFEPARGPALVMWWRPSGMPPTVQEAKARFDLLAAHGPTAEAFTFRQPFPPPDETTVSAPEVDAEFCEPAR